MKIILNFLLMLFILVSFKCKDDPNGPKPPNGPDTTSHEFIWKIDTLGEFQSSAVDVWGISANNVWAIGGFVIGDWGTNIMHFDGDKWNQTDYYVGDLNGIYGFSENNVWAVGESLAKSLISHWNGVKWNTYYNEGSNTLISIWGSSPNDIFAVGFNGTILHYDGTGWRQMTSGTALDLRDVWGSGPTDVYACGGDKLTSGVLLHYDGKGWKNITDSTLSNTTEIKSVWGYDAHNIQLSASPGHFIGNAKDGWKYMYIPDDNTYMQNISGSGSNNIFLVGDFGIALHYNGSGWRRYDQFYQKPDPFYTFYGVRIIDNAVFIAGYETYYGKALIVRGYQQ